MIANQNGYKPIIVADLVREKQVQDRNERSAQRMGKSEANATRLNIYTCPTCYGHVVTVDLVEGVTPFMIPCAADVACKGMMQSSMYRVWDHRMRPDLEWYRPDSVEGLSPSFRQHVEQGGLLCRPFQGEWNPPPFGA